MAAHCAALRLSLYSRTNVGEVCFDLLSGLSCDWSTGHVVLGVVNEQHGSGRYDLSGTGVGSVFVAASALGAAVTVSVPDTCAGAD